MKNYKYEMIEGNNILIAELGYWPDFCDAKILKLDFSNILGQEKKLSLLVHYIDLDLNRDLCVLINFGGIKEMIFSDFTAENVIDKLTIKYCEITGFNIQIEAAAGFHGTCKCNQMFVEVISTEPYIQS